MKRVPGPVHTVAVTLWRKSRARRWTTALPTAQGYGQPLRGSAVAHRLPTSVAFGLTRRCASCPNDTDRKSFPRHRYSHRYTLPIYNGSTRFALPIPGRSRLRPELEKTATQCLVLTKKQHRDWPKKIFIKFRAGRRTFVRTACMYGGAYTAVVTER